MDLIDAIAQRHSVRSYKPEPLSQEVRAQIEALIAQVNHESGLAFKAVFNDPSLFSNFLARYGSFKNAKNVIVCAGPRRADLPEQIGYWGQLIVLKAQAMGLNTCWVAGTFSRDAAKKYVGAHQQLLCVIAIGHGMGEGATHQVKALDKLCTIKGGESAPAWFEEGMWAAQLAPTAMNQQRFHITYEGGTVVARALVGPYADLDLGIVKRNFEIAAGKEHVAWA